MSPDEHILLKTGVQIYLSRVKPFMDAYHRAALRFVCFEEARTMMEHVKHMDIHQIKSDLPEPKPVSDMLNIQLNNRTAFLEALARSRNLMQVARELGVCYKTARNYRDKWAPEFRTNNRPISAEERIEGLSETSI